MSAQDSITDPVDPAVEAFRAKVEDFLVRWSMPVSRFGRSACNDSRFVIDLRNGRSPDYHTRVRVEAWMQAHESANDTGTVPVVALGAPQRVAG